VEAMAPLLIGKMALAALLLPAMTIFRWQIAPAGWKALLCGFIGRCCRHFRRCRRRRRSNDEGGDGVRLGEEENEGGDGSINADDSGGVSTTTTRTKGLRLDNMVAQSLTWLDVAIVFGPHIPVLLPLVLLSLFMARWTHETVGLRRLGLQERRAEFSKPSAWYVLFSVVCQQALTAAVFIGVGEGGDNGSGVFGAGAEGRMALLMVVVGALASTACVAVALAPVRWLGAAGRRYQSLCYRCRRGRVRRRRDLGSVTELSSRFLLSSGKGRGTASGDGSLERPLLRC